MSKDFAPNKLTASNLKQELWNTLLLVQNQGLAPEQANAVSRASREILQTVKTQIQVANHSKRPLSTEAIDFAEK